jgi:hypothetical protein
MSFTEKEKEIFNKGLKIYREERKKSINEFYERIEKELEVSTEEYKNIEGRAKKLVKQLEEYQPLKYVGVIIALMIPVSLTYKIKYGYLINLIFLIIQVYFLNKQINQSKEFKAINKELDDLYKNFEEMQ